MKKIFLIALGIISVLSASAQVWVGGTVSAEHRKTELNNGSSNLSGFSLGPNIGYDLNQRWSVALGVAYQHYSSGIRNGSNGDNEKSMSKINQLSVAPYLRYHFAECGDVRFFCQGGIDFKMGWDNYSTKINGETTYDHNYRLLTMGIDFRPGISYLLNDRITLLATLGAIGWKFDWRNGEYRNSEFYADIYDTFSIGFQINL